MRWSSPLFAFLFIGIVAGHLTAAAAVDDDERDHEDNSDINANVKSFADQANLVPNPKVLPPEGPMIADPAQANAKQPTDRNEVIFHCWGYLGHPETILDIKSFLRWGCQPSPNTCDGIRHVPKVCTDNMFAVYDWVTPRHVHRLLRRCRAGAPRPVRPATGRYIPYCREFVDYLWKKYGNNRRNPGGHRNGNRRPGGRVGGGGGGGGRVGGHHPPGGGHHAGRA